MEEIACHPQVDLVLVATSGPSSLVPTFRALEAKKTVALASKEALVMAGALMSQQVASGGTLLPVDSEPSAIWQCLQGENEGISKLILTASGGAFRTRPYEQLADVTPEEALAHPTWSMGKKVTIDSATLMNKAFEVMESRWMFNVPWEDIEVAIHPESIVHSLVEFKDGSVKAQLAPPDMRLPLQYALFYPQRMESQWFKPLDITRLGTLNFEPMDVDRYPCFSIALEAAKAGGTYPAALCAADNVAVGLFLNREIGFMDIPRLVHQVVDEHQSGDESSLEDVVAAGEWASRRTHEIAPARI
jgi:1-deoxy-D-xylulose-5-phosphate reductoisomerase